MAGLMTVISCGPSAEEKAAAEKKIQDSVSAAKIQMEGAMEAARQQYVDDSTSLADSANAAVAPVK